MAQQQLVARIKKSSRYSHQAPPEGWFAVEIERAGGHPVFGNSNYYRFEDVALGAMVDGGVVDLSTGKMVLTDVAGLRMYEDA